jgi:hypothetical protein
MGGAVKVSVQVRGSFRNTEAFLQRMRRREQFAVLHKYGAIGVTALRGATPVEHSTTANAWSYEIVDRPGYFAIHWLNSHLDDDGRAPVAILLQYGHATGTGGRVQGRDFINPALRPIFDQMASDMWKEVTK